MATKGYWPCRQKRQGAMPLQGNPLGGANPEPWPGSRTHKLDLAGLLRKQ